MKNKNGMTLIEVILSIAIMGIIAVGFFGPMASGFKYTVDTKKFTEDSFKTQQEVEKKIDELRLEEVDLNKPNTMAKKVFGKDIKGHLVEMDIKAENGSSHGKYTVFVPNINVTYEVPEVESVTIGLKKGNPDSNSNADPKEIESVSIITQDNNMNIKVKENMYFEAIKKDGSQKNFLMNVYKWYISPELDIKNPPSNYRDYIIIKEWNEARKESPYNKEDMSIIPNIKKDYDEFSFKEIKEMGLTDIEVIERFSGRFIIYSVTPYSDVGRIGEEKFSNAIYLEPVDLESIKNQ